MESLGTAFTVIGSLGFLVSLIALIVALVKKKRKKPWILSFVAFFVLAIIGGGILPGTELDVETKKSPEITKQEKPKPIVKQKKLVIPKYTILNEDVYDAPVKTQVTLSVLVSGEISEASLKNLLNQLYSSTKARKGFNYHDSPTSIFIYAYTSKERAETSTAQWIAMLGKAHAETRPTININERQIAQLGAEPEERFGLLEEKRKEIWKELILIERRAMKEAEKQYPLEQSLSVGQIFTLSKETPLMPELEPADPMAAIEKVQRLPPLVTIKILKVVMKQQTPWYFIEATSPSKLSLGSGWINSIALIGQVDLKEQLQKQAKLENRLIDKYKDELRKKYGLTAEQLEKISSEGIEKDWPFPRRSE